LLALVHERQRWLLPDHIHRAGGGGQRDDHGELLRRLDACGEFWNVISDGQSAATSDDN
jgi:hypothetical protein